MSLAPWDENGWFQDPLETFFSVPNTPPAAQVASADPMRVAIIFSCPVAPAIFISTLPGTIVNQGIIVNTTTNPVIFTQKDYGPLPAKQWFAISSAVNAHLTVIEIRLRSWPKRDGRAKEQSIIRSIISKLSARANGQ